MTLTTWKRVNSSSSDLVSLKRANVVASVVAIPTVMDLPMDVVQQFLMKFLTLRELGKLRLVSKMMSREWVEQQTRIRWGRIGGLGVLEDLTSAVVGLERLYLWETGQQSVACGELHGVNICGKAGVMMWTEGKFREPLQRFAGKKKPVSVSCGRSHTLILMDDGSVYTMGSNASGQLGLGDLEDRAVPTLVESFQEPILCAVAGRDCSAFLTKSKVFACGLLNIVYEDRPPVGMEDTVVTSPVAVSLSGLVSGEVVQKICLGAKHLLAVTNLNRLLSAGEGSENQLGRITNDDAVLARTLDVVEFTNAPKASIVQISAGEAHNLVLFGDGSVFSFGRSNFGELGIPQFVASPVPARVPHLPRAVAVACGHNHSLVLGAANNAIVAFGISVFGQLGYRPSFWSSSYARDSPFPRARSASESSTSSSIFSGSSPHDRDQRGSTSLIKCLAGGARFSALSTSDGEELYMCGKSSLCAGAGGGEVKSSDFLVVKFSLVP